jgi:hypothetical protein
MADRGRANEKQVLGEKWVGTIKVKGTSSWRRANASGYFDGPVEIGEVQLADVTITASTLEKLQEKLKAHVDLLEPMED